MAVCKYYQVGTCRYGANCRFEHPGANNSNLDGGSKYKLSKDMIRTDLKNECPAWIFSAYGPGKEAPAQLFGGFEVEQSLEEVMLMIRSSPNIQAAIGEIERQYMIAKERIQKAGDNPEAAINMILAAENQHPNRIDICNQSTGQGGGASGVFAVNALPANPLTSTPATNQNPFSTTTQSSAFGGGGASAFGQPSTLGQNQSAFARPPQTQSTFGQPSQMGAAAPAFGQPSQLGASGPAFGQPSQMGASAPAFGQPSTMGAAGPAFGQPSTMGQRPNPFAAAAAGTSSAFGQPSTLGKPGNPFAAASSAGAAAPNPFGQQQPSTMGASPFAQVGQAANSNASPFAQAAQANPNPNPFGGGGQAPSNDQSMDTSMSPAVSANPFAATNSAFANQPAQTNGAFGAPAPAPNPFAATSQAQSQPAANNPFARAQPQAQAQTQAQPPGAGGKQGPYAPTSTKQHPPAESYITKSMNGRLAAFQNQQIIYKWRIGDKYMDQIPPETTPDHQAPGIRNPDGSWRKVLFPDGPPAYNRDTEPSPEEYTDAVKAAYADMAAKGCFDGDMPEVPPMREDCIWTF
ncbi:hypothetical protein GGS20DRAFT_557722 [Poronia punctata]|nr:hypothetical protein GGS20DRAFT_557722 [Poronia punctata]